MRRISGWALLLASVPLVVYLGWWESFRNVASQLRRGEDVVLATIARPNVRDPSASPIELVGRWGDIFQPSDRSCDVVVVSATLDPLYAVDSVLVWESNLLVQSALGYARSDPRMLEPMVRGLIIRMVRDNERFVRYLHERSMHDIEYSRTYVAALCEPHLERTDPGSALFAAGVRWLAVIPLFNSSRVEARSERVDKLAWNVRIAVGRVVEDLERLGLHDQDLRIRGIAIPALAGSETLADSRFYLSYERSFTEVCAGVFGRTLPMSLERIYVVVWDKWDRLRPQEGQRALRGLVAVDRRLRFRDAGGAYVAYSVFLVLGAGFLVAWVKGRPRAERFQLRWGEHGKAAIVFLGAQAAGILGLGGALHVALATLADSSGFVLSGIATALLGVAAVGVGYLLASGMSATSK